MPRLAGPAGLPSAADAARASGNFLSFCDFVDDALFHPRWGYYATGGVRFGPGGHYDTYPLALSPLFGRMVAEYAFRTWRANRSPADFEVCELGAGNGQLCLDTLLWCHEQGRHDRAWKTFAERVRYRIFERSPALAARQRHQLGPMADAVRWCRADLARAVPRKAPFAPRGVIVANEVLDCLPHHKVTWQAGGSPAVVFVVAELDGRALTRARLAGAMAHSTHRGRVRFREVLVPVARLPGLAAFLRRHYPEIRPARRAHFACPRIETMLRNTAELYEHADALWIDYGETRAFHLRATEAKRVFAGPPRSRKHVYDDPGRDDVTFMVDFSVAMNAARSAGWTVEYYGPQAELSRRAGVRLDRNAVDLIVRHRALTWLLAVTGVGPEQSWRRQAFSWSAVSARGRVPVQRYVEQSVREFRARRGSTFKLLILRR